MPADTPVYSTLFHCLYDERSPKTPRLPHYSVFRAVDSRDVRQLQTDRPRVHDFAVIWDEDHDTRIIAVLEEMLMAGLLPGVQFIGEHKGNLSVVLAAATYFSIDVEAYKEKLARLSCITGDGWAVEIGMFDRAPGNLSQFRRCDFQTLVESDDAGRAFIFMVDVMWSLGTKIWLGVDVSRPATEDIWADVAAERFYVRRSEQG